MKSAPRETEKDQKDEVLASLARVLEICFATASDRHRRLIQYLVSEELEGRGDRLKAHSIAIDVLGRSADFNPQTDSVVRVEMGRIRQALDLYYATQGANDPVRIEFEKGSYRPKFAWVSKVEPARVAWRLRLLISAVAAAILVGAAFVFLPVGKKPADRRASPVSIGGPRVAVAPIKFSADKPDWDYLASGLQGEMVGILAEFDWLTVFPIFAGEPIDKGVMERIDYVVRSSAQVANANIAIWVLFNDGKTGAVLWSNRYESPLEGAGLFDLQRKIAIRIASDIGRPRGIVASLEKTHIANDSFKSPEGFDCYLHALRFYTTYEKADYYDAQDCAEKARKAPTPMFLPWSHFLNLPARVLVTMVLLPQSGDYGQQR